MKNKEIKEKTTKERRDYMLYRLQDYANFVLWDIRDDDPDIMVHVQQFKQWYRVYRNLKETLGEMQYESVFVDLNLLRGTWESK